MLIHATSEVLAVLNGLRAAVYSTGDVAAQRAVVQGIGAHGASFNTTMPRWQLGPADWADLLAYLRTLL